MKYIPSLMQEYMKKIYKIPILSRREERRLIKKAQAGDKKAEEKFIEANLKLVVRVVSKFSGILKNVPLGQLDLIQEGNISLKRALKKFDLGRTNRFATYAEWWIRQAIIQTLSDHSRLIRMSKPVFDMIVHYQKIIGEALAQKNKIPTLEEIAEKIGVSAKNLHKNLLLFYGAKAVSVNTPMSSISDKWDTRIVDDIISDEKNPNSEEITRIQQLKEKVRKMLLILTPREEKVLRMRFGVGEKKDYPLRETEDFLGISYENIRLIEARALEKLRKRFVTGTVKNQKFQFEDYL